MGHCERHVVIPKTENMKTKAIEFNADDLVGSVEAFAHHPTGKQKLTLRTATMPLPPPVKSLTPSQVRSIRKKLNVSQPVFAAMMNIPTVTAASWERGRRKPTGAALRMLDMHASIPRYWLPADAGYPYV